MLAGSADASKTKFLLLMYKISQSDTKEDFHLEGRVSTRVTTRALTWAMSDWMLTSLSRLI